MHNVCALFTTENKPQTVLISDSYKKIFNWISLVPRSCNVKNPSNKSLIYSNVNIGYLQYGLPCLAFLGFFPNIFSTTTIRKRIFKTLCQFLGLCENRILTDMPQSKFGVCFTIIFPKPLPKRIIQSFKSKESSTKFDEEVFFIMNSHKVRNTRSHVSPIFSACILSFFRFFFRF